MSEDTKIVTAVYGGDIATQVLSIERCGDIVYITEITFTPSSDAYSGNDGAAFQTMITFEVGAIDAVIRELRKIKAESR